MAVVDMAVAVNPLMHPLISQVAALDGVDSEDSEEQVEPDRLVQAV
jgi:hypothetical protein